MCTRNSACIVQGNSGNLAHVHVRMCRALGILISYNAHWQLLESVFHSVPNVLPRSRRTRVCLKSPHLPPTRPSATCGPPFGDSCMDRLEVTSHCPRRPCAQGSFVLTYDISRDRLLFRSHPHRWEKPLVTEIPVSLSAVGRDVDHTSPAAATAGLLLDPPLSGRRRSRSGDEMGKEGQGVEEHRRVCGLTLRSRATVRCARGFDETSDVALQEPDVTRGTGCCSRSFGRYCTSMLFHSVTWRRSFLERMVNQHCASARHERKEHRAPNNGLRVVFWALDLIPLPPLVLHLCGLECWLVR